jgi:hypothetical protein
MAPRDFLPLVSMSNELRGQQQDLTSKLATRQQQELGPDELGTDELRIDELGNREFTTHW